MIPLPSCRLCGPALGGRFEGVRVECAGRLESGLSGTADGAAAALKSAGVLTRELRKAKAAAEGGEVRELRRALGAAAELANEMSCTVQDVRASFDLDESAYLGSGEYAKELLALAADRGLAMFEEDDRLLCYPSIVRVVPPDALVEIDRKRERRRRPSGRRRPPAAGESRTPQVR